VHVLGATPPSVEDCFQIEHELVLRVAAEEFVNADAMLTARHRTQWRSAQPLADPAVRAQADGRSAVRLRGAAAR
jgi:hypothetical protein